jgi:two-component system nitrogen regulation sensor histidine kinase GlnL
MHQNGANTDDLHYNLAMPTIPLAMNLENRLLTAIVVLDQHHNIYHVNHAAEEFLEQSQRQLVGFPLARWIRNCDFSETNILNELFDGKELQLQASKLQLQSGRYCKVNLSITRFVENSAQYLLIELKELHPAVIVTTDENELIHHRRQRIMMRDLAHEIRNPLGGLRGAAQLLARQVNQKQQAFTDVILREADRLGLLVERVLGTGKPEKKKYFNIHQLIEEVLKLIELDKPDKVKIKRDYDPSLPEFNGYQSSLYQAILNITRNALQALEISGNEISVSTRAEHSVLLGAEYSQMAYRIDINDNGPGVPEDLKQNLFMPMKTGKNDGTGIGLSIATTAIEQQGGCINWQRVDQQTQFSIFLPFATKPENSHE